MSTRYGQYGNAVFHGSVIIDNDLTVTDDFTLTDDMDLNGDLDVDGTTNLDAVDIDSTVQIDGTVTVGVNDTGYDVKFFGAASGSYLLWDEDVDDLILAGAAGLVVQSAATDGISLTGACTDAIHISGSNTTSALHISGDQAIYALFDVDASATDGLKFDIDSSMTLTRGIYLTGSGTATTAINIDVDGTTALNVGSNFSGTDMIVLGGTASGYGIEISGTCTTADILLQNGATIDNDAAGSLTITEDGITLVAAGYGKIAFGGVTDWGTGATGTLIDGTGWDVVTQTVGHVDSGALATACAAAYHALTVTPASHTTASSFFGTWTELYLQATQDFANAANCAAVWGQVEAGASVTTTDTADCFTTGGYFNIITGASFNNNAAHVVNGVRVQSEISNDTITNSGRLAAFECLTKSGSYQDWDYGLYINGSTTGYYWADTGSTSSHVIDMVNAYLGIVIETGTYSSSADQGVTVTSTNTRPVSFLFDDGGDVIGDGADVRATLSRVAVVANQTNTVTVTALRGQAKICGAVDFDGAHLVGTEGYIEMAGANDLGLKAAGCAVAAVRARVEASSSLTHATANTYMTGLLSELHTATGVTITQSSGILAGVVVTAANSNGSQTAPDKWGYGVYMRNCDTGLYMDPTTVTSGIQIGQAATDATGGLTVNATAPVGFYFDDGGAAVTAWSESFTVGLVLPTASTGAAQTGFPSATHVYIDQRANITGPAAAGKSMTALWAGYLVRNNSTLDGFDDGFLSAMQCSLDVDSGSTLASGTTMAGITFGGNWSLGTVSGSIFPIGVSKTNADWNGFMKFQEEGGLVQDAAAGSGGHKYLKVYIGSTLYTIDMVTA